MRTETFEGTVEAYQGKTLDKPISFSGSTEVYENLTEARGSEDWPSDSEILKWLNTRKVTAAKAAEYQKATKNLKAEYEASPEYKRESLIKAILAADSNKTRVQAEGIADSLLG
jgi:hypothetical protein